MPHDQIKLTLGVLAAVFGRAAVGLWIFASYQRVAPETKSRFASEDVMIGIVDQNGRAIDVIATAARQTYWNGWAALTAAAAAVCQLPIAFL
ncbi:hypothetical protein SAMN05444159_0158 [Bradyrhizobium lablabi]|uniref:Uncharacterized protein n=2 Tax=Bradyrhizobium lablabi TaxID=722472 RepID=A0A1M6HYQ7_9BRAD|nr:hypothetical protein SAMN05444159_0158 [Bradyrhizobium lablabi]